MQTNKTPRQKYLEAAGFKCEYLCDDCGQLRLYAKDDLRPSVCGNCKSGNIKVGPVDSLSPSAEQREVVGDYPE